MKPRIGAWALASLGLCGSFFGVAHAASWTMDSATGFRGDVVYVAIKFKGDGSTAGMDASWVLDESRFSVAAPPGPLPASNGGQCAWNGRDTIATLAFAASGVLPSTTTTMCTVPLKIRSNAVLGGAGVYAKSYTCATGAGTGAAVCTATPGHIVVNGQIPANAPVAPSSLTVNLLLSPDAPAPQALAGTHSANKAGETLATFLEVPPLAVWPLITEHSSGEAQRQLGADPKSPEALLERYIVAQYRSIEERDLALKTSQRDRQVLRADIDTAYNFGLSGQLPEHEPKSGWGAKATVPYYQDHRDALRVPQAWTIAGGWGLVGIPDTGIAPNLAELRSFEGFNSLSGNFVQAGNYLPALSKNHGGYGQSPSNLEEVQSAQASIGDEECDPNATGWLKNDYAGHGTHVAGLVAANASDGVGTDGTCRNCGLAVRKTTHVVCVEMAEDQHAGLTRQTTSMVADAITDLRRAGVQVINASFAEERESNNPGRFCQSSDTDAMCLALKAAREDDILIVAAAGNDITHLDFPASDETVVAVGGLNKTGEIWNFAILPGGQAVNCPYATSRSQCGSNHSNATPLTTGIGQRRAELVAPAVSLRSTFYPEALWNDRIGCGDGFGEGPGNDSSGPCTGTSMSAAAASGVFGLLRSAHPLLKSGNRIAGSTLGVREVVHQTTPQRRSGQAWSRSLGYGTIDAEAAVKRIMGQVLGTQMRNRVTPLFRLYSAGATDYAAVATPQMATALALRQSSNLYKTVPTSSEFIMGKAIPGYASFPNTAAGAPRAAALVLTTESTMFPSAPPLVPLFLLDKVGPGSSRDHILLTSPERVQAAVALGYSYLGRQGYVYQYCVPSATCVPPPGTEALHLKCKTSANDCAVFLESERGSFENAGYTGFFSGVNLPLGYAYTLKDSDLDGLPDAAEYLLGTSNQSWDSDGDNVGDAQEYPFAGVPVSDPCDGPVARCPRSPHYIFTDGFE